MQYFMHKYNFFVKFQIVVFSTSNILSESCQNETPIEQDGFFII